MYVHPLSLTAFGSSPKGGAENGFKSTFPMEKRGVDLK